MISGLGGVSCSRGPNTTWFFASQARVQELAKANSRLASEQPVFGKYATVSTAIIPEQTSTVFGNISSYVSETRHGGFGKRLASDAGAIAIAVRLPSNANNSSSARGAPQFVGQALIVSQENGGIPVFLRAPRGPRGSVLAVEFTGLVNGRITGHVSEETF